MKLVPSSWGTALRIALILLGVAVAVDAALGWLWSRPPAPIDPRTAFSTPPKPGVATADALIDVATTLLDKPGGFLRNDITPPGILSDNMPNWEYGALIVVRDLSHVLRNDISRPQAQSTPDPDLSLVEPRFNVDSKSWMWPEAESNYRFAIEHLKHYRDRLQGKASPDAYFAVRPKNLTLFLQIVSRRLGGQAQVLEAGASGIQLVPPAQDSNAPPPHVSWMQTDDVFYRARGMVWALLVLSRGMEIDFHDVLVQKEALTTFQNLERTLAGAEQPMHSPIVFDGAPFGILPDHDLQLAAYVAAGNTIVMNLQTLMNRD